MAGFGFQKNSAFDWKGCVFRIERVNADETLLVERVHDGKFSVVEKSTLLADYVEGHIGAVPSADSPEKPKATFGRPLEDLSPVARAELDRRHHYVSFILERGQPVFTPNYIEPLIREAAEDINDAAPPSATTVYRWFRRYRMANDARALVPRHDLRGAQQRRQPDRVQKLFEAAVEEAYRASPLSTVKTIHDRLTARVAAENAQSIGSPLLKVPSLRTTYRLLADMDVYQRTLFREGKHVADKRFRLAGAGSPPQFPLERVEIDHTPLDLFLIDEETWLPLGRPTLTVLIDVYSRMMVGYHLSFGDPSAAAVIAALRHAILPKKRVVAAIPALKLDHDWPCYGLPHVLVVDNGLEFHGGALEGVALDLGMRIQFCPKHQPQFKGTIERGLKSINYVVSHQLPGTSFARLHLRGDYDPQQHALLTLGEFTQIFEKWLLDIYAQTVHRGIGVTPWAKWHDGLKLRQPTLPDSVRALQQRIGLVTERSLRRDGINLLGIRYNGDTLSPILRAYGEGVKVRVLYDPEDLAAIQVWGPDSDEPVEVMALDQHYAKGLTARQNELIRTRLREAGAESEDRPTLIKARNDLTQVVEELMQSRKQRDRRKAAALRGITNSQPERSLPTTPIPDRQKRIPSRRGSIDDVPPSIMQAFQLRDGEND